MQLLVLLLQATASAMVPAAAASDSPSGAEAAAPAVQVSYPNYISDQTLVSLPHGLYQLGALVSNLYGLHKIGVRFSTVFFVACVIAGILIRATIQILQRTSTEFVQSCNVSQRSCARGGGFDS